ncbi:MAG TPA: recombinase family protein [Thermoplasmata archaeon]|nr:recombinase family protein [Thermoplasmata archaeon]
MGSRVALYARVSTEDQAKEGFSLDAQRDRLHAFCRAQGWSAAKEYVDDGHSGRDVKRPAYQAMMAERESWDKVLVIKMDRIHRNSRNFMDMMDDLRRWGKDFVSATESLDTSTAMGRFVMDIIQRIAQLESEQIGERVYMGMAQKHKQGKGLLGFRRPYGYDYVDGKLVVNEREAKVVRRIFREYASRATLHGIAANLNRDGVPSHRNRQWSKSGLRYMLRNPVYIGRIRWDEVTRDDSHVPIVDAPTWESVQARKLEPAIDVTSLAAEA